jgi:hypothetical protein
MPSGGGGVASRDRVALAHAGLEVRTHQLPTYRRRTKETWLALTGGDRRQAGLGEQHRCDELPSSSVTKEPIAIDLSTLRAVTADERKFRPAMKYRVEIAASLDLIGPHAAGARTNIKREKGY